MRTRTLIALGVLSGTVLGLSSGDFGEQTLHMLVGIAKNTAKDDWLSRI